jgi:hypothetical protein
VDATPPDAGSPQAAAHPDPVGLLDRCMTSPIEREGVAMFVGVHDARPRVAARTRRPTVEPALSEEAPRLRQLFDGYVAGLAAGREQRRPSPDPSGGAWSLIEVLVVMSEQHLRAPVGPAHVADAAALPTPPAP